MHASRPTLCTFSYLRSFEAGLCREDFGEKPVSGRATKLVLVRKQSAAFTSRTTKPLEFNFVARVKCYGIRGSRVKSSKHGVRHVMFQTCVVGSADPCEGISSEGQEN